MMQNHSIEADDLRLLSRSFRYPEEMPDWFALAGIGIAFDPDLETVGLTKLQNEYVRLFINALPQVPCPPYGSFYIEGSLMGASTVRLQNLYQTYGVLADDIPDHISVELEFLAFLSILSPMHPIEEDYRFLLDHLNQWTPEFFTCIEEHDSTGFYSEISRCARKVLAVCGVA